VRQTGKNLLLLGVLAVLAAGLGLYAWWGVAKPQEREERRKAEDARLVPLGEPPRADGADAGTRELEVSRITLQAKGDTTVLERSDAGWRMVSPVAAAVDTYAVDGLVSQFQTGTVKETIEENPTPEDLKRYGLDAPRFTVRAHARIRGGDQEREIVLKGGAENPFDGSVYLQRGDDPRVYSAQGGIRWNLEKSAFDLRDKEVLAVEEKDVRRVELRAGRSGWIIERGDGETWRISQPIADRADARTVSSLLSELRTQRATSFRADSPEERARTGVDKPASVITFTLKEGDPIRLAVGRSGADAGPSVFVLRTQGSQSLLAEVPEGVMAALNKEPGDLRDKSALHFDRTRVARIAVGRADGSRIVVERPAGVDGGFSEDWRVVEPRQGPAKKFKLSSLLWTLESLQAKKLGEERPKSWAKYGVEKPEREVSVLDTSGNVLARLALGKSVPGQEGTRYARGSRDQVLEIDESRLADLPASVEEVLDTPVAAAGATDAGGS
jgi:hypothetical protein